MFWISYKGVQKGMDIGNWLSGFDSSNIVMNKEEAAGRKLKLQPIPLEKDGQRDGRLFSV